MPTVKKMRELKSKHVEFCGLASWEDAQAAYPNFADEEMLKAQFISLSKGHAAIGRSRLLPKGNEVRS